MKNRSAAARAEPAAEPASLAGTVAVSVQGFTDPMDVQVTLDDNGTVTGVAVAQSQSATDGAYVEKVRTSEAFLNQFIGKTAPIAEGEYDVVTGATFASKAVVNAVNDVFAQKGITAAPAAEEPRQERSGRFRPPGRRLLHPQGPQGMVDEIEATVTVENGAVAKVEVAESASATDALYVDMVRKNEGFLNQFIGKNTLLAETDIDVVTGATLTSRAVHGIVNQVIAGNVSGEAEAQLAEEAAAPATLAGEYAAEAQSFLDTLKVTVTLDDEGAITAVSVADSENADSAPYVAKAQNEAFLSQFIGKKAPVAADGVDVVTGATFSCKAVIAAVNDVFARLGVQAEAAAPAAQQTKEAVAYKDGSYEAKADALTVTVTVTDGKVSDVAVAG